MKVSNDHIFPGIIFSLLFLSFLPPTVLKVNSDPGIENNPSPYYIVISKKSYELKVYDKEGWYATYPCVFGSNDLGDKMREGDKKTPEGTYKIILKKNSGKWAYQLMLDYPNEENKEKFRNRKQKGLIPSNARIGGGIAIHATRPQEEWTVDYYQNWTDGCVSLKYSEARDLFSYIPVGTQVVITK